MKFMVVSAVVLVLAAAATTTVLGRPDNKVLSYEADDHKHEQSGEPGKSVTGSYSWTSPEGEEFVVRYIADHLGFRILKNDEGDDAVPETKWGGRADGNQVNFDDSTGGDYQQQEEGVKH